MFTSLRNTIGAGHTFGLGSIIYGMIAIITIAGPLFFIPIAGFPITIAKGFFVIVVALAALLATSIMILKRGSVMLPRHPLFLILGGLVGVGLLGAALSPVFSMSLVGYGFETTTWLFTAVFAFLIVSSYFALRSYQRIGMLYGGILIGFIVLLILHIIRYAAGPLTANIGVLWTNTSTLIGTWGDLGIFFGFIVLFVAATLELASLRQIAKSFMSGIGIAGLVCLAFMNIRMVWIIIGLAALIGSLYLFSFAFWDSGTKTYRKERRIPWYLLTVFVVAMVGIIFGSVFGSVANRHRSLSFSNVRPSVTMTSRVLWKSFMHNPVTGYGPNMFGPAFAFAKPSALSGNTIAANDFVQGSGFVPTQMATGGLLGIIGWAGFFAMLAWMMVKSMLRRFESSTDFYFTFLITLGVAYLSMIAWAYIPGSYTLGLLAVLIGAWLGNEARKGNLTDYSFSFIKDPRLSFFGILGVLVLLGGTFVGGYIGLRKLISFAHFTRGANALNQGNLTEANRQITLAVNLAHHDIYYAQLSKSALSNAMQTMGKLADTSTLSKQAEQVLGVALGNAQAATVVNPAAYGNWLVLGDVYRFMTTAKIDGAFDRATAAYQEAYKRNPNDSTMKLAFAQLDLAKGDVESALAEIKQSIDLYPSRDAYIIRAQIQISQNKIDSAIMSLKQAIAIDPYNANLVYQYGLVLLSQKKYADAIPAFQRAIAINQSFGQAYVYLGISYEKTGDTASAKLVYDFIRRQFTDGDAAITKARAGIVDQPAPTVPETATNPTTTAPKTAAKTVAPTVKNQ